MPQDDEEGFCWILYLIKVRSPYNAFLPAHCLEHIVLSCHEVRVGEYGLLPTGDSASLCSFGYMQDTQLVQRKRGKRLASRDDRQGIARSSPTVSVPYSTVAKSRSELRNTLDLRKRGS